MKFENIHPDQYNYSLPDSFIAKQPLEDRAASKLLYYHEGSIEHKVFNEIDQLLPSNSHLIFNDTKVIAARIIAYKSTGAKIEIFLLEPVAPSQVMEEAMHQTGFTQWRCMIGNAKKWKIGSKLNLSLEQLVHLQLTRESEDLVTLSWNSNDTFSSIIEKIGKVPLPPYIDREPTEIDIPRYQTVYSKADGAVAAPTAGLHFTDEVIDKISTKSSIDFVTLHVSAGTFQPIKTDALQHPMHREEIIISKKTIENLKQDRFRIAVGTTSLRTLESLYWYGLKLKNGDSNFVIEKLYPYQSPPAISLNESLDQILLFMEMHDLSFIRGYTEIFIFPGYQFRLCEGLITNFHMPGTTLMMLIAAFVGDDWKKIYQQALSHQYRFLSYGDSSFLIPKNIS